MMLEVSEMMLEESKIMPKRERRCREPQRCSYKSTRKSRLPGATCKARTGEMRKTLTGEVQLKNVRQLGAACKTLTGNMRETPNGRSADEELQTAGRNPHNVNRRDARDNDGRGTDGQVVEEPAIH